MMATIDGIDHDVLQRVIQAHVEHYAISFLGPKKAGAITSVEELGGLIERLTWDNRTEFTGARSTIASLMFTGGVALALQLVAAVSRSSFKPDVEAIAAAFDDARRGVAYTVESVRHSDAIRASRPAAPVTPKVHKCIPAIVEPNIPDAVSSALLAVSVLTRDEAGHLKILRRVESMLCELKSNPTALTDEMRAELHEAFVLIGRRYVSEAGTTKKSEELGTIADDVNSGLGLVTGDLIPLDCDDWPVSLESGFGFTSRYDVPGKSVAELIETNACEKCQPNLEEMIRRDIASGHFDAERGQP